MLSSTSKALIAIGSQLKSCPSVVTLGVRPNLNEYPAWKLQLIRDSKKIYFPTSLFADMFVAMGKNIFPGIQTYRFVGDKIKQTLLFQLMGLPVPRTGFYFGPRQQTRITKDFAFPFVAKTPRLSSRGKGVMLVSSPDQLEDFLKKNRVAYIQEYLPGCKDYRIVIAGNRIIHSYQRIARKKEFRANVSLGARLSFENIPEQAKGLALKASRLCGFNYSGMDICESDGKYYLLEANMKFGTLGFKKASLDLKRILCDLVHNQEI